MHAGVRSRTNAREESQPNCLGRQAEKGESPVGEGRERAAASGVPRDTGNPVGRSGDHPARLNTDW